MHHDTYSSISRAESWVKTLRLENLHVHQRSPTNLTQTRQRRNRATQKVVRHTDNKYENVENFISKYTNVKVLNSPIKRQRWTEWTPKHDPTICCPQKAFLSGHVTWLMGFSSPTLDWTWAMAAKALSSNHWTAREFPQKRLTHK